MMADLNLGPVAQGTILVVGGAPDVGADNSFIRELLLRFTNDDPNWQPPPPPAFLPPPVAPLTARRNKKVKLDAKPWCSIDVVDTSVMGMQGGAAGAILVYDVCQRASFEQLAEHARHARETSPDCHLVVAACNAERPTRCVSPQEGILILQGGAGMVQ